MRWACEACALTLSLCPSSCHQVRALTRSLEASSATESGYVLALHPFTLSLSHDALSPVAPPPADGLVCLSSHSSGGSQQTPPPVPSSSLRPVPKPASLPASRAPNESTAPLTLPTAHTGRGVNEGTIEDLRTQLGGAALQQPRPADRQDRGPSPTSPGAQRRGMSPLPEGAGRRHAGDAGGERELGAGLGVEGSRTRATGEPSRRRDEGQGGRGRDEGRPGRGEEEGRSRKGHTGEKEGRRDEGRPGSDGRVRHSLTGH